MDPLISAADLAQFREMAESFMDDGCKVEYETTRGALNPVTNSHPMLRATRIPDLPCKVQDPGTIPSQRAAGEASVTTVEERVDVPWDTAGIKTGDLITITRLGESTPLSLLGVTFRVLKPSFKSRSTALRLRVEVY